MIFKKNKGFTLIELLVVIAIIGILSSIVLVSLSSARAKARDARRESDIRQISIAMEMYYDDNDQEYLTGAADSNPAIPNYLDPFPPDIAPEDNAYRWIANDTLDCGTVQLGQWYCVFVVLEADSTKCFAAGWKGTQMIACPADPDTAPCTTCDF